MDQILRYHAGRRYKEYNSEISEKTSSDNKRTRQNYFTVGLGWYAYVFCFLIYFFVLFCFLVKKCQERGFLWTSCFVNNLQLFPAVAIKMVAIGEVNQKGLIFKLKKKIIYLFKAKTLISCFTYTRRENKQQDYNLRNISWRGEFPPPGLKKVHIDMMKTGTNMCT